MKPLIIVEPWFTAAGHPAQSLINTAKTIGREAGIDYLISAQFNFSAVELQRKTLKEYGYVTEFLVNSPSLREGTFKALLHLRKIARQGNGYEHIFFLDAHLVLVALLWPFFSRAIHPKRLSMVYLMGPERVIRSKIAIWLVKRFIKRREVTLYLRTEELTNAWRDSFPDANDQIRYLPSLELPQEEPVAAASATGSLRFGAIGQVRQGKGLDWLVPLFENNRELGMLTVAGTFNSETDRQAIKILSNFGGFLDKFLTEKEMLQQAMQQDYLLMLYDEWDARMESAVLYLAVRANRPVIAYDKGWIGRKIRQFECGLLAPERQDSMESFLLVVPHPGAVEYQRLLKGLSDFREAHSGEVVRNAFLRELAYD